MAAQRSDGPVADFCAALRQLQLDSGLGRVALARQVNYSKSQLYAILDGEIRRPPEWDRVVEPLVRACTGDDERTVNHWRRRHGELLKVYELSRRDRPPAAAVASEPARAVPAQLPADVDVFTGRGQELAELDRLLAADQTTAAEATAVVISAVSGTAGVGKTALAVRWAHRVRAEFPDGQLYVNLRGFDPSGSALPPNQAVRGFLDLLGIPAAQIPVGVDAQVGRYRSLLAGKRMLVLLDNARDAAQVRPLLPGTPTCLTVVTSRDRLTGLVATEGAQLT
ncbi:MAG: helix-turn-helix domain-containing protein, partial [Stackebrandtia sp.]